MIEIINEVRDCLHNGTYVGALALGLTLPDICSQVESGKKDGDRNLYITWVNKHFDDEDFTFTLSGFEDQTFTGNMCYSLRCKILHNGNTDVTNTKLNVTVDKFVLTKPGTKEYFHGYKYADEKQPDGSFLKVTYIGVDYLCERLCDAAEKFYNSWTNKVDFGEYIFAP